MTDLLEQMRREDRRFWAVWIAAWMVGIGGLGFGVWYLTTGTSGKSDGILPG